MDRDFPMYALELSRLRDFSEQRRSQRKIHFRIESDSIPIRNSPLDIWVPTFHRYGPSPEGNVRHLDETSTWRGLSMAQAREIKFWEDMFAAVLEYKISNHLIDIIDAMDECGAARRTESLSHRICESVNNMGCRNYPVNIQEFFTCMIELYKRHGSQYTWLASSGDFRNGLCEFLRTRDCFLDTPLLPIVKVAFSAAIDAQGEPTICGRVKRYAPIVRFTWLDTEASLSQKCHVHPEYVDAVLDPEYDAYVGCPEYQLKSDCVAFEWDASQKGFVGYLRSGHIKPSTKPTPKSLDLTVTGTRFFPDQVRFERMIRLKIGIVVHEEPSKAHGFPLTWTPSYQSYEMSSYERLSSDLRQDGRRRRQSPAVPVDDLSLLMKTRKRGQELRHPQRLSLELAKWQQGLETEHDRAQSEPSSTRASTGDSLEYHFTCRPEPVPDIPAWWKASTERSKDAMSVVKNITPTSLISLADSAEAGAQPHPCPSISSPTQLFKDPATIRGGAHGSLNQHNAAIIPSVPDSSSTFPQRRHVLPMAHKSGTIRESGSIIKHELDCKYWSQLYKRDKRPKEGPSSWRAARKTSSESGAFDIKGSDVVGQFESSYSSSNETIRFPRGSTPPRPSDMDTEGRKRSKSWSPSAQNRPQSVQATCEAKQEPNSDPTPLMFPIMPHTRGAMEPCNSMDKDTTNDQENTSPHRNDSVFSEASRVTAINGNRVSEVTPKQFQAEIKEWYDILFLKQQVEKDLGKLRAGNKSDEEAFEEAFRGEVEAETEVEEEHEAE